ncbi:flagellar basal body P-ring formation chaperone FlgA [Enterobacteriaceae bacterium C23F]
MITFFFRTTAMLLACSTPLFASTLSASSAEQRLQIKLDALFDQLPVEGRDVVRSAELLASPKQMAALCDNPKLEIAGNDTRLAGKRTVVARCGSRKQYLPVQVHATGTWWIASQNLPGGAILQRGDIEPRSGSLDNLPAGIVFNADEVIGQRLIRAITAGKPLLQNQLRQQWRLHAGQQVDIITSGNGFLVRGQGKALNNAAVNDTVKVKTASGQTLSGKVANDGQVEIFFQQ